MIGLRNGKRNTSAGRGSMKNHETSYKTIDRLTNRLEEVEKENKELKEGLFEKFSECYEVNKWTPESGFDSQLDFYIHESWKREPVVDKLRKQVEDLKCCGNCINYIYDMEEDHHYCNKNIFHGKRHAGICSNNWQSDTMTSEERK
jgi:hypothetical protein